MKKHFKQILSLFLCAIVIMGTFTMSKRPEAEAAGNDYNTSKTLTSTSPDDRAQADILHMERTVKENTSGGFDVTLTSYIDDMASTSVPMDVVFVMDQSTSMEKSHKEEVVETIQLVLGKLLNTGGEHRIGFVAYGTGIYSSTTDNLISIADAQNHDFSNYKDWLGAGTHTDEAMAKAQSLLSGDNDGTRTKTCIVLTDGVPTSTLLAFDTLYSEPAANRALSTASEMKASGVSIYVLKLSTIALEKSTAKDFCKRLSSYCNANVKEMDDDITGNTNGLEEAWVYDAEDKKLLSQAVSAAITNTKLYPFVLNSTAVINIYDAENVYVEKIILNTASQDFLDLNSFNSILERLGYVEAFESEEEMCASFNGGIVFFDFGMCVYDYYDDFASSAETCIIKDDLSKVHVVFSKDGETDETRTLAFKEGTQITSEAVQAKLAEFGISVELNDVQINETAVNGEDFTLNVVLDSDTQETT